MNKNIEVILAVLILVFYTSCERTEEINIPLPPEKIKLNVIPDINGELSGYLLPDSENNVEIQFEKEEDNVLFGYNYEIDIMMIFKKALDVRAGRGYNYYGPSLRLELLDIEGKKIEEFNASMNGSYKTLANNLKEGNEKKEWITFSGRYSLSSFSKKPGDEAQEFINKVTKGCFIRIKSEIIKEEHDTGSSSSELNKATNKSDSEETEINKGECDEFLDQYEEFVVEYVKFAKKVADDPQNMGYLSEMSQLANKVKGIEGNLESCKDNDPELAQRFMEIQQKMLNAMR